MLGLYAGYDAENEALFIADTIEKHPGGSIPTDRVAVLYRTNSQSRQIEEALRRYNRKYNVVGGFSFYQRAEVKDIVAYLKLAAVHQPIRSACCASSIRRRAASAAPRWSRPRSFARENGLSLWDAIGAHARRAISSARARIRRWWRSAT